MTRSLTCLLFAAALAAANPYYETILSEVGADSAHQFVELHFAPQPLDTYLNNWRIVTSTSACTLECHIWYDSTLVVDSEALLYGEIGRGSIHINPLGDSVVVLDDNGEVYDVVRFPSHPTGYEHAPLPPATGSISFWNYDDFEDQSMNWYVDSTPTPGEVNDDYGVIAGSVTGGGGVTLDEVIVAARGLNGHCHRGLYQQTGYSIGGLGAGKYEVTAYAYHQGEPYQVTYPESVTVGYGQTTSGIDIVIPLTGVAETPSAPLLPPMRVSGRALLLSGDGSAPVNVALYSQLGSRVNVFHLGPIIGEKRIELPTTLAPGVYFAEAQKEAYRTTVKVVIW